MASVLNLNLGVRKITEGVKIKSVKLGPEMKEAVVRIMTGRIK